MESTKAIIYQGELEYISRCVMDYPDIETGGDLFGFWTYSGFPVIQYVIGPGPKANHQVAFFNQDADWLETSGKLLREAHGLQHIGQWHSHHQMGLASPSSHDVSTVVRAIGLYDLKQFFLVITNIRAGEVSINGFLFKPEWGRQIDHSGWVVLEGESPARKSFDIKYKSVVYRPKRKKASLCALHATGLEENKLAKPNYQPEYWLTKKENHRELKQIIDGLETLYPGVKLFMTENDKTVYLEFPYKEELVRMDFPLGFPEVKPVLSIGGNGAGISWEIGEGIATSTIDYVIKSIKP